MIETILTWVLIGHLAVLIVTFTGFRVMSYLDGPPEGITRKEDLFYSFLFACIWPYVLYFFVVNMGEISKGNGYDK